MQGKQHTAQRTKTGRQAQTFAAGQERWLGRYTVMTLCVMSCLLAIVLRFAKTLIWDPDGVKQHYVVLGYMGRALRGLLAGQGWPMMKLSLGQGMDLLTTLAYCGYTDPLCLLSVLSGPEGIEWVYLLTDLLRLYLSGAAFALYVRKIGTRDGWATACGAVIYAFCGYFVRMLGRHPYFINGGLYLPLLLLAIERVLEDRRWLMYVLITALMLIVNFYFAYMNTLVAVVYILVRLAFRLRDRGVKESAADGFTLLGGYLLGAALSAVVLLPIVTVYLGNSRQGVQAGYSGSMLHYPLSWYREMAVFFFAPWDSPGNYLFTNFAPIALFALLASFGGRGPRALQKRVALLLSMLCACVPLAGWVFNGTAYVSCRWSYILALFVSVCCCDGLPALCRDGGRTRRVAAGVGLLWAGLLVVYDVVCNAPRAQWVAPVCIAVFSVFLLLWDMERFAWLTTARARRLSALFLTATCALYIVVGYHPKGYGGIEQQMDAGVFRTVESQAGGQLLEEEGVYRVSQGMYDDAQSLLLDYMGTSYYWSLVDGGNSRYYTDLGLPTQSTTFHIYNLGGSSSMNGVAAVKYFLRHEGTDAVVPYGFEPTGETLDLPDGSSAQVYENAFALPLGYAYESRLSSAAYEALPIEDKLRALTRYAIVEDGGSEIEGGAQGASLSDAVEIDLTRTEEANARFLPHGMDGEEGGTVTFSFAAPEDSEIYLLFEGMDLTSLERLRDGSITVRSEAGETTANVPHPNNNFYFSKRNFAFCLGSGDLDHCEIRFENDASYRFDRVRLIALPLSEYRSDISDRRAEALTDVAVSDDRVTGRIEVSGDRVLQIAIPFSEGWSARVDGSAQPLYRCGGMYMGLDLQAGEHEIELRYVTPGLKTGALLSAAAVLVTVALAMYGKRRRRQ